MDLPKTHDNYITWDRSLLEKFKKKYYYTVNGGAESFKFQGHEFLVAYAKYLIQYLDTVLVKE